jgi:hypothetical protein
MLRDENQHRDEYGKHQDQRPDAAAPTREIPSMIVAGHLTMGTRAALVRSACPAILRLGASAT